MLSHDRQRCTEFRALQRTVLELRTLYSFGNCWVVRSPGKFDMKLWHFCVNIRINCVNINNNWGDLLICVLISEERAEIALRIEKAWNKRYQQLLVRASNPLHRQKFHLGLSLTEPPQDELEDMTIKDIEDCIKSGITMNLTKFRKVRYWLG